MLAIEVGFDGSCPQSLNGIRQDAENEFTVFPSWRPVPGLTEDAVGRTTRLGFRVRNDSDTSARGVFHIDWQYDDAPPDAPTSSAIATRELYMGHRDFCVTQTPGTSEWRYVVGVVDESTATFEIDLPPGVSEIHWHPPYNYEQCEAFIESLRGRAWTEIERIGSSTEGRDMWLIRISDNSRAAKKPFMVAARMHAYESGGSYIMEGMVDLLLSDNPWAAEARRDWEFFIVPMVNPDGVANGLGKLTHPRGADLQMALPEIDDGAYKAFKGAVDRIEPAYFVDPHNWQCKDIDGCIGMDVKRWTLFEGLMPQAREFGKRWFWREPREPGRLPDGRETFRNYYRTRFGAAGAAFETSWFGRQPEDVRAFGRKALWATLLVETHLNSPYA